MTQPARASTAIARMRQRMPPAIVRIDVRLAPFHSPVRTPAIVLTITTGDVNSGHAIEGPS